MRVKKLYERSAMRLFPLGLDKRIAVDNEIRLIDVFDKKTLGFVGEPKKETNPDAPHS